MLFRSPPLSDESDHMLINSGDKSRGICGHCKCVQPTTATVKDMRFEDNNQSVVQSVLVFVCDACNNNVSIPAQEIKKIGAAREQMQNENRT